MAQFFAFRRVASCLLLITFVCFISIYARPGTNREGASAPTERTVVQDDDTSSPGMVERSAPAKPVLKKKGFPWLLVVAGVVVVGAAAYFLFVYKPSYTLTVSLGAGAQGDPADGTYSHKKGTVVPYSFQGADGFKLSKVLLDGQEVAEEGTITMDGDHRLEVTAAEGMHEGFNTTLSSFWIAGSNATLNVASGILHCAATTAVQGTGAMYNKLWSQGDYTVTMKGAINTTGGGWLGIVLLNSASLDSVTGYSFYFSLDGRAFIAMYNNMSLITNKPTTAYQYIKVMAPFAAILTGAGQMNVLKIVKHGNQFSCMINDQLFHSFTESTYDPRFVGFSVLNYAKTYEVLLDYYYVDLAGISVGRACSPVILIAPPAGEYPGGERIR